MFLWLTWGAHPTKGATPAGLYAAAERGAGAGSERMPTLAMPARSDWRHADAFRCERFDVHDVDVRARAATSAVCARVRARLRVVERLRLPRRHLALRCRRGDLGVDRAPSLLHAGGGWAARRWASALGASPPADAGGPDAFARWRVRPRPAGRRPHGAGRAWPRVRPRPGAGRSGSRRLPRALGIKSGRQRF